MTKVRWGLLSTANINKRLIPAIRASERGELVAVASRRQDAADAYAAEWGIPRAKMSVIPNGHRTSRPAGWTPAHSEDLNIFGYFGQFVDGVGGQFAPFPFQIGPLGIGLGTDGNVFAGGHRGGTGHQAGHAGDEDRPGVRAGRGDPEDQAGRGDDAVVGAEHRGPQPAGAVATVPFAMGHGFSPFLEAARSEPREIPSLALQGAARGFPRPSRLPSMPARGPAWKSSKVFFWVAVSTP